MELMAIIDNSREASYGYDQRVEVFGSKGMVKADNNLHDTAKLLIAKGVMEPFPDFFIDRYMDAYKKEIVAFSESLTKGFDLPVSGNDGLQSLVIGLAAIKSIKENRPIKVSEIDYKQEISMIKKEMISKMMTNLI